MKKKMSYIGITVDNPEASFLEDAFWAEEVGGEIVLRIFTSIIFHAIGERSVFNKRVLSRTSLSIGENRYAFCYEFHFKQMELTSFNMFECSFINICQMDYETLDTILASKRAHETVCSVHVVEAVALAYRLMNVFESRKRVRADLVYRNFISANREIDARGMVGLLMVFLNAAAANFAVKNKIPFVFRMQSVKDEAVWRTVKQKDLLLQAWNNSLPPEEKISYTALFEPVYVSNPREYWHYLLPWYAHISSPGRRLADFINQANLIALLRKEKFPYCYEQIREIIPLCNGDTGEKFYQNSLVENEIKKIISKKQKNSITAPAR